MSGPEGFFQRWSRRKRAAVDGADDDVHAADATAPTPDAEKPAAVDAPTAPAALPEVDLARLPSLESITATTDIRGFLAPGVPAELTRAALRRAWLADPQIRDFVGIAENQWDFTTPGATPGFGELAEDEVRRLVADVMGERPTPEAAPETIASASGTTDPDAAKSSAPQAISAPTGTAPGLGALPLADAGAAGEGVDAVAPGAALPANCGRQDKT